MSSQTQALIGHAYQFFVVTSLPPYTDISACLMCRPASICCPPECLHMSSSGTSPDPHLKVRQR